MSEQPPPQPAQGDLWADLIESMQQRCRELEAENARLKSDMMATVTRMRLDLMAAYNLNRELLANIELLRESKLKDAVDSGILLPDEYQQSRLVPPNGIATVAADSPRPTEVPPMAVKTKPKTATVTESATTKPATKPAKGKAKGNGKAK